VSRDATGVYSAWAVEAAPCPICLAGKGETCDLDVQGYAEHGTHWRRTESAPPYSPADHDIAPPGARRRLRYVECPLEGKPQCEADGDEDPCLGCPGWGIECGAVWYDIDTGEEVRAEDITEDPHKQAGCLG
jgi:hypothetical protein